MLADHGLARRSCVDGHLRLSRHVAGCKRWDSRGKKPNNHVQRISVPLTIKPLTLNGSRIPSAGTTRHHQVIDTLMDLIQARTVALRFALNPASSGPL